MSTLETTTNKESRAYHHGNLQETLLMNALTLLESTQSTEFSIRELSRIVGVSSNAAYKHFANKEELLTALAVRGFQQLLTEQAQATQDNQTHKTRFMAAGLAYVVFARQHPALFRLMFGRFAVTHRNQELSDIAQLAYEGMRYSASLALNIPLTDAKITIIATKAWSLIHGLSHLIIDGQFDAHSENDIDDLIHNVLQEGFTQHSAD